MSHNDYKNLFDTIDRLKKASELLKADGDQRQVSMYVNTVNAIVDVLESMHKQKNQAAFVGGVGNVLAEKTKHLCTVLSELKPKPAFKPQAPL